jgi:heme-degrading monooxygenase HmoA
MWMRVARARVDPVRVDEASQQLSDVAAAIGRMPGRQSVMVGVDRGAGQQMIVSTWDTEEHARFSREALGEVMARVQSFGGQLDAPEFFEVITQ